MSQASGRYRSLKELRQYRPMWDVVHLQGSDTCLHWNARDLPVLDEAIKLCKGSDVAVQAGSNLGLFPKRLAEAFDTVFTFEPDKELSEFSRYNAPERNIVHIHAALGNSTDPVSLGYGRRDPSDRPAHEGLTHIKGAGDIPQVILDEMGLHVCDLIYLDIEGYELFALQGAERTINSCRPVIGVEINSGLKHYDLTGGEIREWIKTHDYKFVFRMRSNEVYVPC
jgi:FkbM family methyltransferase